MSYTFPYFQELLQNVWTHTLNDMMKTPVANFDGLTSQNYGWNEPAFQSDTEKPKSGKIREIIGSNGDAERRFFHSRVRYEQFESFSQKRPHASVADFFVCFDTKNLS